MFSFSSSSLNYVLTGIGPAIQLSVLRKLPQSFLCQRWHFCQANFYNKKKNLDWPEIELRYFSMRCSHELYHSHVLNYPKSSSKSSVNFQKVQSVVLKRKMTIDHQIYIIYQKSARQLRLAINLDTKRTFLRVIILKLTWFYT